MTDVPATMADSKVEVRGWSARYYDLMMNIGSLGRYGAFIRDAIAKMEIRPRDRILDLGCGTGRNSRLMAEYLSEEGRIVGIDIGEEMIRLFRKTCAGLPQVSLRRYRIDEPLPFREEFDKVFISFVFHGFTAERRARILENVKRALRPGGRLVLLDFNSFRLREKPFWFRTGFKLIECPLAFEFIEIDWNKRLRKEGFLPFREDLYFLDTIRLLQAEKAGFRRKF